MNSQVTPSKKNPSTLRTDQNITSLTMMHYEGNEIAYHMDILNTVKSCHTYPRNGAYMQIRHTTWVIVYVVSRLHIMGPCASVTS